MNIVQNKESYFLRFIDFKDGQSLEVYLQNQFPVGSDTRELVAMLVASGAECHTNINNGYG